MTTVLVYGAAGFIGRHLVRALTDTTGWDVAAHDRDTGPITETPNFIVNLAADADARWTLDNPLETVTNGTSSTAALLQQAREWPVRRFIQVSTAEVYGTASCDHTTRCGMNPQTPYAATKAAQDMLAVAWRESFGVPTVVARTANVFGEDQPEARFLTVIVRRALAGEPITVVPGHRRFIHVDDVAAGIIAALTADTVEPVLHLTGLVINDHARFAESVLDALYDAGALHGDAPLSRIDPSRPGHFGDLTATPTLFHGWRPRPPQQRINETVQHLLRSR